MRKSFEINFLVSELSSTVKIWNFGETIVPGAYF